MKEMHFLCINFYITRFSKTCRLRKLFLRNFVKETFAPSTKWKQIPLFNFLSKSFKLNYSEDFCRVLCYEVIIFFLRLRFLIQPFVQFLVISCPLFQIYITINKRNYKAYMFALVNAFSPHSLLAVWKSFMLEIEKRQLGKLQKLYDNVITKSN